MCVVVAPPGSDDHVDAVLAAVHAFDRARRDVAVRAVRWEDVRFDRHTRSATLREQLDTATDVGLAVFGPSAGADGGGRATEIVDALISLDKPVEVFRHAGEPSADVTADRRRLGRYELLRSYLLKLRDHGESVTDYHDLADLNAQVFARLTALVEADRATVPGEIDTPTWPAIPAFDDPFAIDAPTRPRAQIDPPDLDAVDAMDAPTPPDLLLDAPPPKASLATPGAPASASGSPDDDELALPPLDPDDEEDVDDEATQLTSRLPLPAPERRPDPPPDVASDDDAPVDDVDVDVPIEPVASAPDAPPDEATSGRRGWWLAALVLLLLGGAAGWMLGTRTGADMPTTVVADDPDPVPGAELRLALCGSSSLGAHAMPELLATWLAEEKRYTDVQQQTFPEAERSLVLGTAPGGLIHLFDVAWQGSEKTYTALHDGRCDVGMMSHQPGESLLRSLDADEVVVALDGVVFVGKDLSSDLVTPRALGRAFTTRGWVDRTPLTICGRDPESGTHAAVRAALFADDDIHPEALRRETDRDVLACVRDAPGPALGYLSAAAAGLLPETGAVRPVRLREPEITTPPPPSLAAIKAEVWPLTRRLTLLLPSTARLSRHLGEQGAKRRHTAEQFATWVTSASGQAVVRAEGLVDLSLDVVALPELAEARGLDATWRMLSAAFTFEPNSLRPDARARSDVKRLASWLDTADVESLAILGFEDASAGGRGSLSTRRALAVRDLLLDTLERPLEVPIRIDGQGQTNFVRPNLTDAGKQANRRVEIWVQPGSVAAKGR